jgi:iron complex outermembrane receptor protein
MSLLHRAPACALFATFLGLPVSAAADEASTTVSGLVVRPGPRPADRPLSVRGIEADRLSATVNATTVEDTIKYLPAIFVRRRHIGDTQAPITTRTSGVGASARSLIYADGVLLSALIGNNNSSASPRWGMVAPDEVERIEVLYGPFSAAYAGNSIGAVVNIVSRKPQGFEAQAKVSAGMQHFAQYGTKDDYPVYEASASLGDRRGPLSWRMSANHLQTRGQPLSYVTALRPATSGSAGTPVSGGFDDRNRTGAAIVVLGAGGLERQTQDNAKLKLEWEITPKLTASYLVGFFGNRTDAHVESYLRNAAGQTLYSGALNIGGFAYNVAPSAFANNMYRLDERHWIQALSVHGAPSQSLRWEVVATLYDYGRDIQRTPSTALAGGGGSILDLGDTGWRTFDAKATWTPTAAHSVTVGLHHDRYELGNRRFNTSDWLAGDRQALAAASLGKTQTDAVFVEDAIRVGPQVILALGVRQEHWRAFDGVNYSLAPVLDVRQPKRDANRTSPKAVLVWTPAANWAVSASVGRANRFPTVGELYQVVTVGQELRTPNPDLDPEKALSTELSVERAWPTGRVRLSLFTEDIDGALVSQTAPITPGATTLVAFVQNVDKVRSRGVEVAAEARDVLIGGLDLSGSVTWVDAETRRDAAFPAAVGKRTPQVARLRWTAVATWRATERLTLTTAARYSSRPFGTLDNSDQLGHAFQGFEGYLVVDARATWKIDRHWSAAIGVDNLNNRDYFVFHPFPQRSVLAELRYVY